MNERERAILRGKPIVPQTADEAALKYAVDHAGGGDEPSYEVVFEATLGDGSGGPEGLAKAYDTGKFFDVVGANGEYFINSKNYPLVKTEDNMMVYNGDDDSFVPADPSKPVYVVYQPEEGNCQIAASDDSLSNTTVRILKATEEPSGGGDFLVTCDFAFGYGATMTVTASNFSNTCAEIFAAHENGQTVVLRGEEAESGIVIDCPLLAVAEETEDETPVYLCQFKGSYFVPEGNGTDFDIFVVLYGDEPTTFVMVRPHEDTFIFNATDTGTVGQDGEHLLNVNTSANEFIAAVDAGKDIIVCIRSGGARMYVDCGLVLPPAQDGGDYEVSGTATMATSSPATVNVVSLVLHKSGDDYDTWTTAAYASIGRVVPVSTSADAGKVLTVDSNGTPKWVTPT